MWQNYSEDPNSVYEKILKRAKDSLPDLKTDDNRFNLPKIASTIQGNRTFLRNMKDILGIINRPQNHFLKFLSNELGTSGNVQGSQAIFQGKHPRLHLDRLLKRYVSDYVLCPECSKPDTKFVSQGRIQMMKCEACGASSSIRSVG